ncbi:MAG: sigma-70 family RNA polymerase sigma factor [Ruminococcus sp.]|nr:sigma-70 family RNA polymerase sigma factor [Candidatus Copronaster equi]
MTEKKRVKNIVNDCYDEYYTSIFRYCFARLGSLNEHSSDCVQDTFLVLYDKLLEGVEVKNYRAFLYRTADIFVMRTIDRYQKQQRRTVPLEDVDEQSTAFTVPDDFDYDKCADILISMLNSDEQELYKMKYSEQKSLTEISEILNIKPSAVAKRTSRLRQKIKSLIIQNNLFENEVTL